MDILFKGITRPALKFGMSYQYLIFVIMASLEVTMMVAWLAGLVCAVVLVMFGWWAYKHDYYMMSILWKRQLTLHIRNRLYWKKTNTYLD